MYNCDIISAIIAEVNIYSSYIFQEHVKVEYHGQDGRIEVIV